MSYDIIPNSGTVAQNHDVFWTEIKSSEIQHKTGEKYIKIIFSKYLNKSALGVYDAWVIVII